MMCMEKAARREREGGGSIRVLFYQELVSKVPNRRNTRAELSDAGAALPPKRDVEGRASQEI